MFWDCDFPESRWSILLKELSGKQEVSNLCLSNCSIADQAAPCIAKMRNLEVLDLSNNQIGECGMKQLAAKLFKLRELLINTNRVGDDGLTAIADNLTNLVKLEISI